MNDGEKSEGSEKREEEDEIILKNVSTEEISLDGFYLSIPRRA